MSEIMSDVNRPERNEDLMTVLSGWGALVLFILGIHRWASEGTTQILLIVPFPADWWGRALLIFALGLGIMWAWGYWDQIRAWTRTWVRGGGLNTTAIAVGLILCLIIVNTL